MENFRGLRPRKHNLRRSVSEARYMSCPQRLTIIDVFRGDLVDSLGAGYTFWVYAAVSLASWVFCYWLVPETKGRSLEEINEQW